MRTKQIDPATARKIIAERNPHNYPWRGGAILSHGYGYNYEAPSGRPAAERPRKVDAAQDRRRRIALLAKDAKPVTETASGGPQFSVARCLGIIGKLRDGRHVSPEEREYLESWLELRSRVAGRMRALEVECEVAREREGRW